MVNEEFDEINYDVIKFVIINNKSVERLKGIRRLNLEVYSVKERAKNNLFSW